MEEIFYTIFYALITFVIILVKWCVTNWLGLLIGYVVGWKSTSHYHAEHCSYQLELGGLRSYHELLQKN